MSNSLGLPPYTVLTFHIDISEDAKLSVETHEIGGYTTFTVFPPSELSSTSIKFRVAPEKGTTALGPVTEDGSSTAISVTVPQGSNAPIAIHSEKPAMLLASAGHLQLEMGSNETGQDRVIKLGCHT